MDAIVIRGGNRLEGRVQISGAKNAVLPLIAATILTDRKCTLHNVPQLRDIRTMLRLLAAMGASVSGRETLEIDPTITDHLATYDLVRTMRASVLVLGPLLARYGQARVSLPGGCAIGARPIDQHLKGLTAMGADIQLSQGYVEAKCDALQGTDITCDMVTVTGTMNLMMAATLAQGTTRIFNAAQEPEVGELARALNKMGAQISGIDSSTLCIEGVKTLNPVDHPVIGDRIEAGTFMIAAAITRGDLLIQGCSAEHLMAVVNKLQEAGVKVTPQADGIHVCSEGNFRPLQITTAPYPDFPTDMQAQFMVLASLAEGESQITETIFENRFMHVPELCRMNAKIKIDSQTATISGPTQFSGTTVMASDLRASAALVLAGLVTDHEETTIRRVYHLDRGYDHIERRLSQLGADIRRIKEE